MQIVESKPNNDIKNSKGKYQSEIRVLEEDSRLQKIIEKTPSLHFYKPPFWGKGAFSQITWLIFREIFYYNKVKYTRNKLTRPDGGTVCIDVANSKDLNEDAPIVMFIHSITGSSNAINSFVRYAIGRGWRSIVLNRRGHDHPLTSPNFNLMGDIDDTVAMIHHVKTLYPNAKFFTAVGISAGSGQVVSYIGREAHNVEISAAVSLCPAYDISQAFANMDSHYPLVASLLLKRIKAYFLKNNSKLLENSTGYKEALNAKSLHEFAQFASPMSGAKDWEDFLREHNPMSHFKDNQIPCLILNSLDDPICVKANIPDIKYKNYALVLTKYGSHIAFAEGLFGQGSWMEKVTMDFLESCFDLLAV